MRARKARKARNELRRSRRGEPLPKVSVTLVDDAAVRYLLGMARVAKRGKARWLGDPSLLELLPFLKRGPRGASRLDPRFRERWLLLRDELRAQGYTVKENSAFRSRREQEDLIRRWQRRDPAVITEPAPPGQSAQQYGMAIDVTIDPEDYDVLGELADQFGILQPDLEEDPVHVELPGWRQLIKGWSERRLVPL